MPNPTRISLPRVNYNFNAKACVPVLTVMLNKVEKDYSTVDELCDHDELSKFTRDEIKNAVSELNGRKFLLKVDKPYQQKGKVCELQIDTRKLKKLIIKAVPYVAFSYVGNLIGYAYRTAEGDGFQEKILHFMSNLGVAFARIFPSLHPFDLLFGLGLAGVMRLVLYVKSKNKKKFRQGEEYDSAVWGGEKDIEPYMDLSCPENNVILTRTESLTMGKPSAPKFARNKNILVIGGSGSGKTRFFVKPNLMQMHSSYVVTDPKGTVLVECGRMLQRGRPKRVDGKVVYRRDDKGNYLKDKKGRYIPVYKPYKIKVFNTIDFGKSMHYNPFA